MPDVKDNRALSRCDRTSGDAVAFVGCRRAGDGGTALLHTEVPRASSGNGAGSKLVRGVLGAFRAERARTVPRCGLGEAGGPRGRRLGPIPPAILSGRSPYPDGSSRGA